MLLVYDYASKEKKDLGTVPGLLSLADDAATGTVCILAEEAGAQRITVMDVDGRPIFAYVLPQGMQCATLTWDGEMLYLLGKDGLLYRIPVDGELSPEHLPSAGDGISSVSAKDGKLFLAYGTREEIAIFEANTVTELARCAAPGVTAIAPFPYAEGKYPVAIWRNDSQQVSIIDAADGSALESNVTFDATCSALCATKTALFTLSADRTQLSYIPLTELGSADNTLYLVNCTEDLDEGRMAAAVDLFHQRYPGVNIVQRWIDDPRDLTTALMSGDQQIDVIFVQEDMLTSSSVHLLKSGATLPLQQFDCIEALPWDAYAFSRGALTVGDSLYGLPFAIEFFPWAVNDLLLEEMGLALPEEGWTWDEFFTLADAVDAYNQEHDTEWLLLDDSCFILPALFYQYGNENNDLWNGTADYNNEDFIKLVRQWQSLVSRGLVEDSGMSWMEPREDALLTICAGMSNQNLGSAHWILPPKLDSGYSFPLDMTTMQISSNSKHPEMAAWFMACCFSPESLHSEPISFQPLLMKDWRRYPDSGEPAWDEDEILSEANIELWLTALAEGDSLIWYHDLYRDQWREFYPALLDGTLTPEAFAAACQQRADMVLGE